MNKVAYSYIAWRIKAIENCRRANNTDWARKHMEDVREIVKQFFPCGSGFDAGTIMREDESTSEKLVFATAFHHVDEHGCYDGWTQHEIIVTACLWDDFDIRITGRDRNDVKSYIHEIFRTALRSTLTDEYIDKLPSVRETLEKIA
jgi:hypothetical protein